MIIPVAHWQGRESLYSVMDDGSAQYFFTASYATFIPAGQCTWECWIKPKETLSIGAPYPIYAVVGDDAWYGNYNSYLAYIYKTGVGAYDLRFETTDGAWNTSAQKWSISWTIDKWMHLSLWFKPSVAQASRYNLIVDGADAGAGSVVTGSATMGALNGISIDNFVLFFGYPPGGSQVWDQSGYLDDWRMFDGEVRSVATVLSEYKKYVADATHNYRVDQDLTDDGIAATTPTLTPTAGSPVYIADGPF